MQAMFAYAESMDLVLSSWAVSRVMNMDSMFDGCTSFTGSGLETWMTSSATSMNFMFRYVTGNSLEQSKMLVAHKEFIAYTAECRDAESFKGSIGAWDVSRVTGMQGMFR
jgi:Mycoplasma protein of unknown function, DUF285